MTRRGRFVTLEGADGAGKTTSLGVARRHLEGLGVDLAVTREPGGTPLAEELRNLLLAPREEAVSPMAETLLMFAARAQHVQTVIAPALAAGRWVLCERFTDATRAYQGAGRGIDEGAIDALAGLAHPNLQPDLTLYLDLPVELALERIGGDALRLAEDRFEREQAAFFQRVRNGYLSLAQREPRICVIDAAGAPEAVAQRIAERLDALAAAAL